MLFFSILFLAFAMKKLPVGRACTVWAGIGATGTIILGMLFFGESASIAQFFCLGLILSRVIGLEALSP